MPIYKTEKDALTFQGIQNNDTMLLSSTNNLPLNTQQIFNISLEHHNWRRTSLSKHVLTCLAALTEVAVNPASGCLGLVN